MIPAQRRTQLQGMAREAQNVRSFAVPPVPTADGGRPRRVGVEIEFAGLTAMKTARIVAETFSGNGEDVGPHQFRVRTHHGTYRVELDTALVKMEDDSEIERAIREIVGDLAEFLVPVEIVAPPLPFDELSVIDQLVARIGAAGGRGTDASVLYAFGMHLNVEASSLTAGSIGPVVTAYALAEEWLRQHLAIDMTRRLTVFIEPYPTDYLSVVADYPDDARKRSVWSN